MRPLLVLLLAAAVLRAEEAGSSLENARRKLASGNVSEKSEGLKAFETSGPRSVEDLEAIAALLGDPLLRGAALRAAGGAGEELVQALKVQFADAKTRDRAARGLAAIGGKAALSLAKLGRESDDLMARDAAFKALAAAGPSAAEALIGVLEDSGPKTRCEASHYLVDAASHATALPAMERALDNRDQEIRLNAVRALRKFAEGPGGLGEDERQSVEGAREALKRGAARGDAEIRTWCEAELLDRAIRDDGDVRAATEALVAEMTSKDRAVRLAALGAFAQVSAGLARFKEPAPAESLARALLAALGEEETAAAAALSVSTALGNDPVFANLLLEGLKVENACSRRLLLQMVSMVHEDCRKAARELVAPFLESDEEELRLAAESVISSFDEKDKLK